MNPTSVALIAILPVLVLCLTPTTAHARRTKYNGSYGSSSEIQILDLVVDYLSSDNHLLGQRVILHFTALIKYKLTRNLPEFREFIIPILNGTIKTLRQQGIKNVFDVMVPLVKSYRKNSTSIFHFVNTDKFQRMMALTIDQFNTAIKSNKLNTSDASEALREIFERVDWKVIFKGYLHEFDISKILNNELVQEIIGDFIPKSVVQKYIPLMKSLFSHFNNLQPDQVMSKAMEMLADNLYNADLSELTDDFFTNVKTIIGQVDWGKIVDTIIDIPDTITDKVPRIKSIAENVIGNLKSLARRFGFGWYLSNKKSITTTTATPTTTAPTTTAPTTTAPTTTVPTTTAPTTPAPTTTSATTPTPAPTTTTATTPTPTTPAPTTTTATTPTPTTPAPTTTTAATPTPTTTTPPIVFSVGSSQDFTPVTPTRVPMEIVIYNEGSHFHPDDNTFYAPITGVYFFTFSGVSRHQSKLSLHLFTEKPGEEKVMVARAMAESNIGRGSAAASVFVKLTKGEKVSVWSWGSVSRRHSIYGAAAPDGPTTLFSGKLEQQLPE